MHLDLITGYRHSTDPRTAARPYVEAWLLDAHGTRVSVWNRFESDTVSNLASFVADELDKNGTTFSYNASALTGLSVRDAILECFA